MKVQILEWIFVNTLTYVSLQLTTICVLANSKFTYINGVSSAESSDLSVESARRSRTLEGPQGDTRNRRSGYDAGKVRGVITTLGRKVPARLQILVGFR